MMTEKQSGILKNAERHMVGGCSAGGRFHAINKGPLYVARADGSKLYDIDGREYIEYHNSAGPMLYGYNNPEINAAVDQAMRAGNFINFETPYHAELAELVCGIIPCAEMMRLHNSGTEATMAATRLARGYTNREIIIKMEGHFHGMNENIWFNHNAVGKMDEIGEIESIPETLGVPRCFSSVIKNVEYNDIDALERVVGRYKDRVACVILEPISFNCGCYPARREYLQKVRALCDKEGIVLIFDEVITGFRIRPGSAQAYYGVTPDLTTLAKAMGGGFPIAATVGRKKVMQSLNPTGGVCSSGTSTGALMPVLAAIACMKIVKRPDFFDKLEATGNALYGGMNDLFKKHGVPGHVHGLGARFGIYFGVEDPEMIYNWRQTAKHYDKEMNTRFIQSALDNGLYFHDYGTSPVPPHNGFGLAHTAEDVAVTLEKMDQIFKVLK